MDISAKEKKILNSPPSPVSFFLRFSDSNTQVLIIIIIINPHIAATRLIDD